MKHVDRIEQAITQVRKELKITHPQLSPVQNNEYWNAVQKAEKDFNVSGVKLDSILQATI